MKHFFNKDFLFGILIFFLLSLTPLLWFKGNVILVGHDNVFPLQVNEFLHDRLFTWSEHHGLGYDQSSGMGSIILHTIDVFPSFLGFSLQTTQKIVYCFWFFAMLFSTFLFCWNIEKWGYISSKYFKYILPVLYTFNFYTLEAWWIGERTKFELMVVLPIFLLMLLSLLRSKGKIITHAIAAGFLLSVFNGGGWKGITLYGGLFITIIAFVIYTIIFKIENNRKIILQKFFLFFLSFSIFFIALNAYSILPFLSHTLHQYKEELITIGGADNVKGWVDVISQDTSFANLFRFQGIPEWYNADHPYGQQYLHNPLFIIISYLFIILIFLSVLIKKNTVQKKFYFCFFSIFLVTLIFAAGSHPPFGSVYLFFIKYIPGFAIFRSPIYKFGYAYWFAGSFLIAYTLSFSLDWVIQKFYNKEKIPRLFHTAFILPFLFLLVAYHYPFLTGNIFIWSKQALENRVTIPRYVFETADWIREHNDGSRILLLPQANSNWRGDTYTWKFFSLYPLLADISRQPFLYNNDSLTGNETNLVNQLYEAILHHDTNTIYSFSDMLRINYFIVRNDFYYNLNWSKTDSPELYTRALKGNNMFAYQKSFGQWDIYQLKRNYHIVHAYPYNSLSTYNGKDNFVHAIDFLTSSIGSSSAGKTVLVDSNDTGGFSQSLIGLTKDNIYFYNCITCDVMSRSIEIQFPVIRVLPTSPFYPILDFVRSIRKKEPIAAEESGYHYLGEALRYTQELYLLQVNFFNKDQITREAGVKKTINTLTTLYNNVNTWIDTYINTDQKRTQHYDKIATYLAAQEIKINYFLEKDIKNLATGNPKYYSSLEKMLRIFTQVKHKVVTYNNAIDYITEKTYYPQVIPNMYDLYVQYELNTPASAFARSYLKVENTQLASVSPRNTVVYYGSHAIHSHTPITLHLPQNNLAEQVTATPSYKPLELNGTNCMLAELHNVKMTDNYRITLKYLNDFSDRLFFVIYTQAKYQKELDKSVIIDADDLNKTDEKFITKDFNFVPQLNMDTVFAGVCSSGLTREIFQAKINMQIKNIYLPELILVTKSDSNQPASHPISYSLKKINQTKYKMDLTNVTNPFLLAFYEKYNTDWKAYIVRNAPKNVQVADIQDTLFDENFFTTWFKKSIPENQHIVLNGYMNGWYIDQSGDYSIIIEYRPQMLFYQGLFVSGLVLLITFIFLIKQKI